MALPTPPGLRIDTESARALSTLLSYALVAFTIEFDNEFERQMPHRTTRGGGFVTDPWLVSLAMWSNCMRFVVGDGVRVADLEQTARTKTNLKGMERWGYIVVAPDPADKRPRPPLSAWLIKPTSAGQRAQTIWKPLFATVEERWKKRFGVDHILRLRQSLGAVVRQIEDNLPDCLPILGYGFFSVVLDPRPVPGPHEDHPEKQLDLPGLMARVLLKFALDFEQESDLSFAICANVVRVLDDRGVPVKDLPARSGVSKEAILGALGFLGKRGMARQTTAPGGKTKVVFLTEKGVRAQTAYRQRVVEIERLWLDRFGKEIIQNLRESCEELTGCCSVQDSLLFRGLDPYPDGWRTASPRMYTLPQYPMVLHRGGFPDGS